MTASRTPLVSIVIPTFESAAHLRAALDSALAQTHPHLEICVSDHASTDATWEIVRSYGDRLQTQRISTGGGAERNWNAVTQMASGDYVKLLCADDLIHPTCVARQVEALETSPGAALASARRSLMGATGVTLMSGRGLGPLRGMSDGRRAIRELVRRGTNLLGEPGTVLVRRSALAEVGGWCASHPYLIDQHTYMRILESHDMVGLDDVLATFRVTRGQWSVRLAQGQAAQTRSLHSRYRSRLPDVVRAGDVAMGNVRATGLAVARRAAYVAWRRQM